MKAKLAMITAVILLPAVAEARARYLSNFNAFYEEKGAPMDMLSEFRCGICHVNPRGRGTRTDYGNDFRSAGRDFAAVESVDSDGDDISNLEEILAGTNPGDASSN